MLRVEENQVIIGVQIDVGGLPLTAKGLATTRSAKHNPVGALEVFAVCQYHAVGGGIQPIVDAAGLEHLAGTERQKDCRPAGGKPTLDLHLIDTDRQCGHKALFLLVVQTDEVAVMGIGDTVCGVNQVLQLLTGGCRMGNEDRDKKHLFIVVLQILQKLLGFLTEGHKVGRQNVHIKAGTNRSFLLVDFCLVQIAQFPLDHL